MSSLKVEIISIGNEILLGHVVNSNATHISQRLRELGIAATHHISVGDEITKLGKTINEALKRSNVVITTGGLGPTEDDTTLEAIAKATGKGLVFKKEIFKRIKDHFDRRRLPMPQINRRQAYIPRGAKELKNMVGTAPGLIIEIKRKTLIALPGVPDEMIPMMAEVIKYLKKRCPQKAIIESRIIKVTGLPESAVAEEVGDLLSTKGDLVVGIYPHTTYVDLKIHAKAKDRMKALALIKQIEKEVISRLGDFVYGIDHETLEGVVGELLTTQKKTIAIAESCTGGLISDRLTNVPGSSKYFVMGLVAYSNRAKVSQLGVSKRMIETQGAVSSKVALAMSRGIKKLAKTHLGVGVTGIAGPTGKTPRKPIGLVFIGLSTPEGDTHRQFNFLGDRGTIKQKASEACLDMVRRYLIS